MTKRNLLSYVFCVATLTCAKCSLADQTEISTENTNGRKCEPPPPIDISPEVMRRTDPISISTPSPITVRDKDINVFEFAVEVLVRSTENIENPRLELIRRSTPPKANPNPFGTPIKHKFNLRIGVELASAMLRSPDLTAAEEIDPKIKERIFESTVYHGKNRHVLQISPIEY